MAKGPRVSLQNIRSLAKLDRERMDAGLCPHCGGNPRYCHRYESSRDMAVKIEDYLSRIDRGEARSHDEG